MSSATNTFQELNLNDHLLKAVEDLGFTQPSEIQQLAIPALLKNNGDFVGQAQTGTGKTAAFVLPLLQKIAKNTDNKNNNVQALILTPTRELAKQVEENITLLGKYTKIKSIAIFGGASYEVQKRGLRKGQPQIVVGTPGRVMDLIKQRALKLDQAEHFILDEADEMLNMGFFDDVQEILSSLNEQRKLWMFSATMPNAILSLIKKNFKQPEVINIKKKSLSNSDIEQLYYVVKERQHFEALCRILDINSTVFKENIENNIPAGVYGLVFCQTRKETQDLSDALKARGYKAEALNGDMGQAQREKALANLKSKRIDLIVCTDVAARGIDINNLTHVINFGFPREIESYVHRIGRTGRAGMKGTAITLVDPRRLGKIKRVEGITKQKLKLSKLPSVEDLKKALVISEINKMSHALNSIKEKGEDFRVDATFEIFQENMKDLSKEDVLKIMFARQFNSQLRRYNDVGPIDENHKPNRNNRDRRDGRSRDRNREGGRDSRRSRSNDRSNDRRADSRSNNKTDKKNDRAPFTGKSSVRISLDAGTGSGLKMEKLLVDFSKQTGIDRKKIRNVKIKRRFTFLEVPESEKRKAFKKRSLKIGGAEVKMNEQGTTKQ